MTLPTDAGRVDLHDPRQTLVSSILHAHVKREDSHQLEHNPVSHDPTVIVVVVFPRLCSYHRSILPYYLLQKHLETVSSLSTVVFELTVRVFTSFSTCSLVPDSVTLTDSCTV